MVQEKWTAIQPSDLLETLRGHLAPVPYVLALYSSPDHSAGRTPLPPCELLGRNSLCESGCRQIREVAAETALKDNAPAVFYCPAGLLNFAVPFIDGPTGFCLLGGGIRETSPDLLPLEALSNAGSSDGTALLARIEALPSVSRQEVEEAARKVHQLLPNLLNRNLYALTLEKNARQLDILSGVSSLIDRVETVEQLFTLVGETLIVLLDLNALAMVLVEIDGQDFRVQGSLGLELPHRGVSTARARELLQRHPAGNPVFMRDEVRALFPGIDRSGTVCIPLASGREPLGFFALFGEDLPERDLRAAELLAGRAAARLRILQQDEITRQEKSLSARLVSAISAISMSTTCEELCRDVVEMASDLLGAASGSLMLLEESGDYLEVKAARGMNPALASSMRVRVGSGISGRVAASGFPLLVADIEKDARIATSNRPRFRTKSFLSVPLILRDRIIGVLNLADKENGGIFSESDLNCLTALADHAARMTERTLVFERTCHLEELSVTDPLTGLYNRRQLEKRLEEELSRSRRQHLSFSLLMIDLDNFKTFNDCCGHLAGDHALKRTAALLQGSAREMDVVTRYGGEEFCVLVAGTSKRESVFVAERIRRAIETEPFPREKELPQGRLTTSVGIASFPEDGDTAADLLGAADLALYAAKDAGRNRIVLFDRKLLKTSKQAG